MAEASSNTSGSDRIGHDTQIAYAPFICHWDINRLPYNGEADRWFDPAWLVAGGH